MYLVSTIHIYIYTYTYIVTYVYIYMSHSGADCGQTARGRKKEVLLVLRCKGSKVLLVRWREGGGRVWPDPL